MRIVAKTAPLRQWEVERELRARVKRGAGPGRRHHAAPGAHADHGGYA